MLCGPIALLSEHLLDRPRMEAVLPYEIFLSSIRVQLDQGMSESEYREALLAQLELLDERRLRAAKHMQVYQK